VEAVAPARPASPRWGTSECYGRCSNEAIAPGEAVTGGCRGCSGRRVFNASAGFRQVVWKQQRSLRQVRAEIGVKGAEGALQREARTEVALAAGDERDEEQLAAQYRVPVASRRVVNQSATAPHKTRGVTRSALVNAAAWWKICAP